MLTGGFIMKNDLSLWQFGGFAISSLGGSLLHFLYNWTNKSVLVAPFSAINESTWEHMKLLFFPMLIFAIIQSLFFKDTENFWSIKLTGILTGIILIPVLFYTLNGVFGKYPEWINIAIFFIATAIAYLVETRLFKTKIRASVSNLFAFIIIVGIGILFVVFTFFTPKLPIFKDPVTSTYGTEWVTRIH